MLKTKFQWTNLLNTAGNEGGVLQDMKNWKGKRLSEFQDQKQLRENQYEMFWWTSKLTGITDNLLSVTNNLVIFFV